MMIRVSRAVTLMMPVPQRNHTTSATPNVAPTASSTMPVVLSVVGDRDHTDSEALIGPISGPKLVNTGWIH